MYKIELSIPYTMSLFVNSSAGSEEPEENEEEGNITEEDIADVVLSTSDEDFEKLSPEDFEKALTDEALGDDDNDDDDSDSANDDEPAPAAADDGSQQAEKDEDSEQNQPSEDTDNQPVDDKAYNEAFNLLYGKPIKASGREVQLRSPEHARNFIEMGIDYNKKMHAMKPHMKTLKTLEKEGLLGSDKEERLNLLLEVERGNKDALKRLIAESDIDPLDLADEDVIEAGRTYQPQNHMISDKEVEIEEALNSIEGSPSQQKTLDVMTKEFDQKSREIISDNPGYIVALNKDIESGVYDEIMDAVNYRKDMRNVPAGMSDMELYIQTANELNQAQAQQSQDVQNQQQVQRQPNKQRPDKAIRKRRNAMSGSKSSSKAQKKEYDPIEVMSMSDDDFEKKFGAELL